MTSFSIGMRLTATVLAAILIGLTITFFVRVNDAGFKRRCAAYQIGVASMSFPDNTMCEFYWKVK